jgi:general secretion pathway protein F
MQQFRYRALDSNGSAVEGLLDANTVEAAATQLQELGLLVLQVAPSNDITRLSLGGWLNPLPLNGTELARFTQQLATLIGAGQPLERALSTLVRQPSNPQARQLLERVRDRVKAGQTLSHAMSLEGIQFPPLYLSLIKAGEAGGALGTALGQLTAYLERALKVRGEIINALIYPAFLLIGVLGSLLLLLAYVVPQFVPIFSNLGVPIPLITEAILSLGQFLADYGLYVALLIAGAILLISKHLRTIEGRSKWHKRMLQWWVAGPLLLRLETARLAHTLGTLLSQGVPLIASFDITLHVCKNQSIREALERAILKVKDGGRLSTTLEAESIFPDLAIQMIQVGEETGTLDTMLLKVGSIYEDDARRSIDRLLAALVPTLTLIMATVVAVIMLAIMLPLMSLTSNI